MKRRKGFLWASCICLVMALLVGVVGVTLAQPAAPATPVASVAPSPEKDLGATLQFLVDAFQGGKWWIVGATVAMVLVWSIGKFLKPKNVWLPVIAAGVAMLQGLIVEFMKPDIFWYEGLWVGLLGNGNAALFYSVFGKRIFKQKKPPAPPPNP